MIYKHLFGPVPSRRLGVSLGIDLVPHKTCTYDCIFCECGRTTDLTCERREYVPTEEVLEELDDYLTSHPLLDYITFSGSGEPTLHTGIGNIIHHITSRYPEYRVAILTNGCLLTDESVRMDILEADLIIPTLSAVSQDLFRKIHRPYPGLDPVQIINGLVDLRKEFSHEIWLEVFIVPGINTGAAELARLRSAIERIQPDRVQLNTLDRPGAVEWVRAAGRDELERIADYLDGEHIEIIAPASTRRELQGFSGTVQETIVSTLERRPCTVIDLAEMLGLHPAEVNKYLEVLLEEGLLEERCGERGVFFRKKD